MRMLLISLCLLAATARAQTSTTQQMLPEKEPSLADQARAAKVEPAEKAKIVVDNETLDNKKPPIPDLGLANLEVNAVVDKIVQYKETHSRDDAKQVIGGWFLDQKAHIAKLDEQEKLYFQFQNRSASSGADWEVRNRASTADNLQRSSENQTLQDLWKLRDLLRGQYGKVRDRSLSRGVPRDWLPKEPGDD